MTVVESELSLTPSLVAASPEELELLATKTAPEQEWYETARRFESNRSIIDAAKQGELVMVGVDVNVPPVYPFRKPCNNEKYPPFLLPAAQVAYRAIGHLWRDRLRDLGADDPGYRLAATSFVRSEKTQAKLVADPEKLASPNSTHCVGAAMDYDTSGYYWWSDILGLTKVSHPGRDQQKVAKINCALGEDTPTPSARIPYDQRVMDALVLVFDDLHSNGTVNHILEFAGQPNQCSHVAINPTIGVSMWRNMALMRKTEAS